MDFLFQNSCSIIQRFRLELTLGHSPNLLSHWPFRYSRPHLEASLIVFEPESASNTSFYQLQNRNNKAAETTANQHNKHSFFFFHFNVSLTSRVVKLTSSGEDSGCNRGVPYQRTFNFICSKPLDSILWRFTTLLWVVWCFKMYFSSLVTIYVFPNLFVTNVYIVSTKTFVLVIL